MTIGRISETKRGRYAPVSYTHLDVYKRQLLERVTFVWKRMKFTYKVTARNLFRYKKRFFMTVVGIAGCTALLVTGFGLHDSISDIVYKQFGEVFTYDAGSYTHLRSAGCSIPVPPCAGETMRAGAVRDRLFPSV